MKKNDLSNGRRDWLLWGAAAAAAVAGAGVAWWRLQPHAVAPDVMAGFWNADLRALDGSRVDLQALRSRPLLVNFWATWCPPCVAELPMLDAFHRDYRSAGWQVLGIAIDQPVAVQRFLQKAPVGFPIALGGAQGTDLGRAFGNATGGLPFTVVIAADGTIAARKIGELQPSDLESWRASTM